MLTILKFMSLLNVMKYSQPSLDKVSLCNSGIKRPILKHDLSDLSVYSGGNLTKSPEKCVS